MFPFPHQLKCDSNELASVEGLVEVQHVVGTQDIVAVREFNFPSPEWAFRLSSECAKE